MKQERLRVGDGVSVYQRHRTWWLDARVNNGIRVQKNLRTRNRSQAVALALQVVATGSTPSERPKAQLESLSSAADRYEKQLPLYCRKSSIKRTMPVVRAFVAEVGGQTPTRLVERSHVLRFRELRSKSCSNHTLNGDVVRVGGFIRWMLAEQLLDRDITLGIRKLSTNTVARETISADTVVAVLRGMEGHPWLHDWVLVLANTGMRPQEALHVRGRDLDLKQRLLHVRSWGEWMVKDAEDRSLMLNEEALIVLSRRKLSTGDDEIPLFASTGKKSRVRPC